ncbi:MAG: exodeoxyribonuclease VII large subunit [Candidatus Nealsonbacteria bacterium]
MEEENQQKDEKIFSISDYIKIVNQGLKAFRSKIIGEVSEVSFGPTGHVYFTLKDEKDESIIKCVIWKSRYDIYGIELKEGIKIIATGYPEIYAPWGKLSFKSEVIEHAGEGTLKKEYEKLKEKLTKEGLFEEVRKRPIPKYPQKVGIITSKQGAVLADFLNNLGRFGLKIKMIDSRVEGQAAIADLLLSIKTLKKENIEVLVIMRGGGSLESMLAFNNESLVREITNFSVPVIAAIGHHKDVPLVALAADRSVSTPSIAATVLSESWEQATSLLEEYERDTISSYENLLENANLLINQSVDTICGIKDLIFDKYKEVETALKISFQAFKNTLQNSKNNLKNSWKKSIFGFNSLLSIIKQQLEHSEKIVYLRNPETQLKLGYSIARCGGRLIRSIRDTKIGEDVDIRVVDGTIISKVKNINKINKKHA